MTFNDQIRDVPHPGQFIREELEERAWSQRDLAYILGTPEQAVNMIIAGKRGVSPEMAKTLGKAFDVARTYLQTCKARTKWHARGNQIQALHGAQSFKMFTQSGK